MKLHKLFPYMIVLSIIVIILWLFGVYVFIGTYIFPIAPHWVTQLPPNPPKPQVEYGEFDFRLSYSINGKNNEIEDTIICEFIGFDVISLGGSKRRIWRENLKNINNYELFSFRDEERKNDEKTYSSICIETIDEYKIVIDIADAEWFLGEPEYKISAEMPCVIVYDIEEKYYLPPKQCEEFLEKHNFEIISWYCDSPIVNSFK